MTVHKRSDLTCFWGSSICVNWVQLSLYTALPLVHRLWPCYPAKHNNLLWLRGFLFDSKQTNFRPHQWLWYKDQLGSESVDEACTQTSLFVSVWSQKHCTDDLFGKYGQINDDHSSTTLASLSVWPMGPEVSSPPVPLVAPPLSSIQESSIPTASIVQSYLDPVFYNILLSLISTPTL